MKVPSRRLLFISLGIIVAATSVGLLIIKDRRAAPAKVPQKATVIAYSTDTPDEQKPTNTYQWVGGPNDPKRIHMPSIDAEGYVQNIDVDQHKQMAVPNNIHLAGWFVKSQAPGTKGLSIMNGHVDGRQAPGIFTALAKVQAGNRFTVEMGDGRVLTYIVHRVETVPIAQAADILYSQDPAITKQLNLITCGGTYTQDAGYDRRVIVIAAQQ